MSYEISRNRLFDLVNQALIEHELATKITDIASEKGFTAKDLKAQLIDEFMANTDESTVWRAASPHIEDIRLYESKLDVVRQDVPKRQSTLSALLNRLRRFLVYLGILLAVLALIAVIYGLFVGWSAVLNILSSSRVFFIVAGGLLVALITFYILGQRRNKLRYELQMEQYMQKYLPTISELEKNIEISKEAADNAVIESGIKTNLREMLNEYLERSYELTLEMLPHEGLAEVRNEKYDIPTEAYEQTRELLRNMRGGSIGLAGPRGSGKTTLIHSFCEMQKALDSDQRQVLSVMTSAPVSYEARDFIILVFKSVCKRLLSFNGEAESTPWGEMNRELRQPQFNFSWIFREIDYLFGRRGALLVTAIGLLIFAFGFVTAVSMSWPSSIDQSISQTAPAATPSATTSNEQPTHQTTPAATPLASADKEGVGTPLETQTPSMEAKEAGGFMKLLEQLGITPVNLIRWGGIFIITGFAGSAIRLRRRREWMRRQEEWERGHRYDPLKDSARRWLKDLRFQQSFSSGWSGSLNLPVVGLEAGHENAMELAQNQLSLPEIIDGYKVFVRDLAKKYAVIIGIDELDKIGTPEEAHRFLNGIKALFGIDECFYLVSVSESAMSSFERRGLPIRDAFDSSFDKIVYVDYLDYKTSKRLLNRRVIGIPIPFMAFCYCMSGGLPRDLIRSCRMMFEILAKDVKLNSLSNIVNIMIQADLKLKLQAVAIAAKQLQTSIEANKFLEEIYQLENSITQPSQLLSGCKKLFPANAANTIPKTDKTDGHLRKVSLLMIELGAYLYYSTTLQEYFANLDVAQFKQDEIDELDKLARARQLFTYSIAESRRIITSFRQSHKMDI